MKSNGVFTCRPSASGKRLLVFCDEQRLYSKDISSGILKVSIENNQLTIWTKDAKTMCFELGSGKELYVSAHNGNKLTKEEKKLRKKQYISRLENEKKRGLANG
jgi:hypothetical protein